MLWDTFNKILLYEMVNRYQGIIWRMTRHKAVSNSAKERLDRRRIKVGHTHAAWLSARLCVSTTNTQLTT